MWGPEDQGRIQQAVTIIIKAFQARGGDSPKDRRKRDKILSGSPNGKDGVQRESQGR